MKHIGLIQHIRSQYDVLNHFMEGVEQALRLRPDIKVTTFSVAAGSMQDFMQKLQDSPKLDLLIAFNSYFVDKHKKLFCDYLKIPTLFWLVDAPYHYDEAKSSYAKIACIDRGHCKFLHNEALFLPHAAKEIKSTVQSKEFDCVMLSSAIPHTLMLNQLLVSLPSYLKDAVMETIENIRLNPKLTVSESFEQALERDALPEQLSYYSILKYIDLYLKGLERVQLLRGLSPNKIDLFGSGDWKGILGNAFPHVTVHSAIDYSAALDVMAKSKVVLSSCASIRDGAHERVFEGIAHGSAVVVDETPYLKEQFSLDKGVLFYQPYAYEYLAEQVSKLLSNENRRNEQVLIGQAEVAEKHLWYNRIEDLLTKAHISKPSAE